MCCGCSSDLRLNDDFIGQLMPDACLWLGPLWFNLGFSLAITVCVFGAIFFENLRVSYILLHSNNSRSCYLFQDGDSVVVYSLVVVLQLGGGCVSSLFCGWFLSFVV